MGNVNVVKVLVLLEDHVVKEIDRRCGGRGGGKGRITGRGRFIRETLHETLGLGRPGIGIDHRTLDLSNVKEKDLSRRDTMIVRLYRRGKGYQEIAETLQEENIATPRGATWTYLGVRRILERIERQANRRQTRTDDKSASA
jgi:hypothetical protein